MRQIYKYAKRVIFWLGLPDEGRLAAFCNVRDLREYRKKYKGLFRVIADRITAVLRAMLSWKRVPTLIYEGIRLFSPA